ncbi:WhiB family transcriptional regulator [Arthrobacter roseus]|uniref:WhiB family transcriptional regulator n=1 Tax=Arthrobacter roseus TaxID=136274 RepID=UPI001965166C|nr:WhiB family transcriptional regulator [Arthrobacter roseus]MBM7848000.1 WhiB family redox-sensing transcriptional regulator [Arthrobacter roseus]
MGQAQQEPSVIAAQAAERYGSRGVPTDWYVDPADPDASDRHRESVIRSLEDQATSFLAAHEALEPDTEGTVTAFVAPQRTPTPEKIQESVSQPVWIGLPGSGFDDDNDGELSWQTDALCAQTDPEAFFPEKGGSTRDAKRVCGACNVRSQCLEYALANDERFGIWGGMSERERRRLRKQAV